MVRWASTIRDLVIEMCYQMIIDHVYLQVLSTVLALKQKWCRFYTHKVQSTITIDGLERTKRRVYVSWLGV